uniref:Uncharacterized protein n=1 Tax=Varanus komodoensis TaxID=61221 RepID=A0A8D2JC66_VARKO
MRQQSRRSVRPPAAGAPPSGLLVAPAPPRSAPARRRRPPGTRPALHSGLWSAAQAAASSSGTLAREALAGRAAPHAQLQVLLLREGADHVPRRADGEGQLRPRLAHRDGGADVGGPDLHVLPGRALADAQAAAPGALPAVDRAVLERRRQTVHRGPVDLLVDAVLHVLKDDGELRGEVP